jgi:adenylate cyclase
LLSVSKTHPDFDYEAEGLLDDVDGEAARAARIRLLDYLIDEEHVELDEVKLAHLEKRLFLLPVERALGGEPIYNAAEVAERANFDLDLFLELRRSLGLADPDPEQRSYSELDVKTMKAVGANMDMGMSLESIREINRVLGASLSQLAVTVERQFLATFINTTDDEAEMAKRYAAITRATTPDFAFVLQHLFNLHMRDSLRSDFLGSEAVIDLLSDTREVAVAFADLVGFTSLGEQIPAEELGAIAERLNSVTAELIETPIRLVKSIGDAVMLTAPEPKALVDLALDLVEAIDAEGEDFPALSVGIAFGEALGRSGDIYGPPVNLASRLSDVARPSSVLVPKVIHDELVDEYDWTDVGRRRFKGIEKPVALYRVRKKGTRRKRDRDRERD